MDMVHTNQGYINQMKTFISERPILRLIIKKALSILTMLLWNLTLLVSCTFKYFKTWLEAPFIQSNLLSGEFKHGEASLSGLGKTVLVTTGRQAKTLHTVRALKEVGARVIVTDYDQVNASRVSVDCDLFIQLPPLPQSNPLESAMDEWVANFSTILLENKVDVIIPVSTINEVLVMGYAKRCLKSQFPHIQWICPGLDEALLLDDRGTFANLCQVYDVPSPESGVLTSAEDIAGIVNSFPGGIMMKRIESSVNRAEEIVHFKRGVSIPNFVNPSENDPWQWQKFVTGKEASVWYIALNGDVMFQGCYASEADLTKFDPVQTPAFLDSSLRRLIRGQSLTGQFAFDFFLEDNGSVSVIECNPRSSSVLETVSTTPFWGASFFGFDMTAKAVSGSVGFLFHRNSWPFSQRKEGFFSLSDPFPFFVAEILWPLHSIATKGLTERMFKKIDVNICKIIRSGRSPPRNIDFFRSKNLSPIELIQ